MFVCLARKRDAARAPRAVRLVAVIVGAAGHREPEPRGQLEIARGRVRVVIRCDTPRSRRARPRRKPSIHSSWPSRPGMRERRDAARLVDPREHLVGRRARSAARTRAGRARASGRTPRWWSATWPPATSARAIHGRPAAFDGSSTPAAGWRRRRDAMPSARAARSSPARGRCGGAAARRGTHRSAGECTSMK